MILGAYPLKFWFCGHLRCSKASYLTLRKWQCVFVSLLRLWWCYSLGIISTMYSPNACNLIRKSHLSWHDTASRFEVIWVLHFEMNENIRICKLYNGTKSWITGVGQWKRWLLFGAHNRATFVIVSWMSQKFWITKWNINHIA